MIPQCALSTFVYKVYGLDQIQANRLIPYRDRPGAEYGKVKVMNIVLDTLLILIFKYRIAFEMAVNLKC